MEIEKKKIQQVLEKTRQELAQINPNAVAIFELMKEGGLPVEMEVSRSDRAPKRNLYYLAQHQSVIVRHAVAKNKNADLRLLTNLSADKDQLVRDYARINLNTKS